MIERNKHPAGRISNVLFGLCNLADGLVRILSLGFLHSRFPISYARHQAMRNLKRLKAARSL